MKIYHPKLHKEVEADNIEVKDHTFSENGEDVIKKCVEFDVIGRQHTWRDWSFYEVFKKANSNIIN